MFPIILTVKLQWTHQKAELPQATEKCIHCVHKSEPNVFVITFKTWQISIKFDRWLQHLMLNCVYWNYPLHLACIPTHYLVTNVTRDRIVNCKYVGYYQAYLVELRQHTLHKSYVNNWYWLSFGEGHIHSFHWFTRAWTQYFLAVVAFAVPTDFFGSSSKTTKSPAAARLALCRPLRQTILSCMCSIAMVSPSVSVLKRVLNTSFIVTLQINDVLRAQKNVIVLIHEF